MFDKYMAVVATQSQATTDELQVWKEQANKRKEERDAERASFEEFSKKRKAERDEDRVSLEKIW